MDCQICDDLNPQLAKARSDQSDADHALASATNEDEQGLALLAAAQARREVISIQHRIQDHKQQGCQGAR